MADRPNRRWFQFHLFTAIVMMLAAGGLLGLNIYAVSQHQLFDAGVPLPDYPHGRIWAESLALHTPFALPLNIVINVGVILAVGYFCESIIRRREARNP